jgi:hypothetical protein
MNYIRKFRGPMESPINSGGQFTMLPEIIHDGLSQENNMEPLNFADIFRKLLEICFGC